MGIATYRVSLLNRARAGALALLSPAISLPVRAQASPNYGRECSAGACPSRSWHGEGQALALRCGVAFFFVARGPVPRDRSRARGTRSHARVACEDPRPTVTPRYARFQTAHTGNPFLSELLSWCALNHHQRQIIILLRFTHKFVDILYDSVNYLLRRVICRHLGD